MLGSDWGELGGGKAVVARERMAAAGSESCSLRSAVCFVLYILLIFIVVITVPFAVLLNCPYPDPPVFPFFFPFSSAPQRGEGWQSGLVALLLSVTAKL